LNNNNIKNKFTVSEYETQYSKNIPEEAIGKLSFLPRLSPNLLSNNCQNIEMSLASQTSSLKVGQFSFIF
jgi:hypothetical protein